jgi:glycine oxidase
MLAPGAERAAGTAHTFAVAARERYPAFIDRLAERTGVHVPLNREGVLQVALDERDADALRAEAAVDARWLGRDELRALEPILAHAAGALLHPLDGAVDNVLLVDALERLVAREPRIHVHHAAIREIELAPGAAGVTVHAGAGRRIVAGTVVLATGAWLPQLAGLPRALPIEPVRGQMIALGGSPLRHVAYGPSGYLVPRSGRTLVGATMERAGFDAVTTAEGLRELGCAAAAIAPSLAGSPVIDAWAGLRPVTPDLLPVLGPDPDAPQVVYACGHSRNGILMAPLTAECIGAVLCGAELPVDVTPFRPERFAAAPTGA